MARDAVDAGGQVGVAGCQVGVGVGQGCDEVGGVVVREGVGEPGQGEAGPGREIREGGDLAGEPAQIAGVAAGPGGDGAAGGAAVAGGLYPLFAGAAGGPGAYAQVAAFGGLAAGDTEGVGEVGPAGTGRAGGFDQSRFPSREVVPQLAQQEQGGQCLFGAGGRCRARGAARPAGQPGRCVRPRR